MKIAFRHFMNHGNVNNISLQSTSTDPDHMVSNEIQDFSRILNESMEKISVNMKEKTTSPGRTDLEEFIVFAKMQLDRTYLSSLSETQEDTSFQAIPDMFSLLSQALSLEATGINPNVSNFGQLPLKVDKVSSAEDFENMIDQAASTYGVDRDLIKSVIHAESDFDPNSTSNKGAMGLMQLMPETAKELGVKNPYDPEENIMAGTRYLKSLLLKYDGDITLTLAAYNWGMGNVERHPDRFPRETREYIKRITRYYRDAMS